MLDDQSPIDKELKYAILTFEKMTEETKKCSYKKRWAMDIKIGKMSLKELGLLVYSKKYIRRKNI